MFIRKYLNFMFQAQNFTSSWKPLRIFFFTLIVDTSVVFVSSLRVIKDAERAEPQTTN